LSVIPPGHTTKMMEYRGDVYFCTTGGLVPVLGGKSKAKPISLSYEFALDTFGLIYHEAPDSSIWTLGFPMLYSQTYYIKRDKNLEVIYQRFCENYNRTDCFTDHLMDIDIDSKGNAWIAGWAGLVKLNPALDSFDIFHWRNKFNKRLKDYFLHCVLVDSKDHVWIGHHTRGISKYIPELDSMIYYDSLLVEGVPLYRRQTTTIYEDGKGQIWIGTTKGLFKYNPETTTFNLYSVADGLPQNNVKSVIEDKNGEIWVATMNNIAKFNREDDLFYPFYAEDGLPEIAFNNNEAYCDEGGNLFFGGDAEYDSERILTFHPDKIERNISLSPLIFEDFQLSNSSVKVGDTTDILTQNINLTEKITLKYSQNVFSIHYAALEYTHPERINYEFQLIGFDDQWRSVGKVREATYTNLAPGDYEFQVRFQNNHGFLSDPRTLAITILPPWYRTWWAYTLWTLLTIGLVYGIYRFQLSRHLAEEKAKNLEEMDTVKSRLYQNITHEFRTPLALILGNAKELKTEVKKQQQKYIQRIENNGQRLLWLINQLLDLSKIENGSIAINYVQADIIPYLQSLTHAFEPYANPRGVGLQFQAKTDSVVMDFDPEKIQQIVSNLLSNAIKYNEKGGSVQVLLERQADQFSMQIQDSGIGISDKELPHIFNRFHQVDASATRRAEGTGIGLALTKELVELLDGKIEVQSELGKGSIFTVLLPIRQSAELAMVPAVDLNTGSLFDYNASSNGVQRLPARADRPTLLLVEDHGEMLDYLSELLQGDYQLLRAVNGREGLRLAEQNKPDLIVSDVMMPEMDGFTLCELLKNQEITSHIPVILLTAKADHTSRLEGLEYGADAYLEKPFQREELRFQIQNLLSLRAKWKALHENGQNGTQKFNGPSDPGLKKITEIITKNLSNAKFSVDELSREMNLVRQQVYNKIKQTTGMSPTRYIKHLRIEKSKELLLNTDENISQISYMVGFNSPASFSNAFRGEVGCSPKEFRDKYQ